MKSAFLMLLLSLVLAGCYVGPDHGYGWGGWGGGGDHHTYSEHHNPPGPHGEWGR